ncbi:hypothetical protein FRB97_002009 [Tulasnella sp. 331]|nr:hypothetical protein FRB97_002009 [Tulasnella sp. 331]
MLPVAKDVYPGIAPERFGRIHKGKLVFITGGGRRVAPLDAAKDEIELIGGEVDFAVVDVTDMKSVEVGVAAAVKRFGKIDSAIANAGKDNAIGTSWPSTSSIKPLFPSVVLDGPRDLVTSGGLHNLSVKLFGPEPPHGASAYNIAKHATNRLAEWIDIDVKSFAVDLDAVCTNLSAWIYARLTSGSEHSLGGRYVDVTSNLEEHAKLKTKIVKQDALKHRLALPV